MKNRQNRIKFKDIAMLNPQEIADALANKLSEKGYEIPEVRVTCTSNNLQPDISVSYRSSGEIKLEYFWGHIKDPIGSAKKYIEELPQAETTAQRTAFEHLSQAVDTARKVGLDFLFEMKTENLLPSK